MDILFGEVTKTYKYYLSDGSVIIITQNGDDVKIHLVNNWIIKFHKRFDEVSLTVADGGAPYYTSRSKERAIKFIDDIIIRAHGCNPVHNIIVNLIDEIMQPYSEIIPIV